MFRCFLKKKWWQRSSWFKVGLSLIATWRRWEKAAYWRNWSEEAKGDFSNIFGNFAKIYRAISQRPNLRDYLTSSYPHLPLYSFSEEQSTHEIVRLTAELTTIGKRTCNQGMIFWIRCRSFHFVVGQSKAIFKLQPATKVNYSQLLFVFILYCMHSYSFTFVYKCWLLAVWRPSTLSTPLSLPMAMFQTAATTSSSPQRPPTSLPLHRHPRMRQVCHILLRIMVQLIPTSIPNPGLTPPFHRQPPSTNLLHPPITSPPHRLTTAQLPFVRFLHSQYTFQTLIELLQHRNQVRTSSKLLRPPHPCQCTTPQPHSSIP